MTYRHHVMQTTGLVRVRARTEMSDHVKPAIVALLGDLECCPAWPMIEEDPA